ncbi:probable membrane-associated kinase regulator 1 [Humulus lupulus]|uniref:probable membrane-associated kinase regulator 1 n=1 Tax=Humulus lupulus TaxID=3486 RepID=UPI002B417741|nr:probable membrane-associated kinase regulator 1 [Humulus lupulus]
MEKVREDNSNSDVHDHQEEEDVSLCDLPVHNSLKEDNNDNKQLRIEEEYDAKNDVVTSSSSSGETQEEFAFGSVCGGSLSTMSEMCSADELFFRGQILPLRLSVSSDAGPARIDPTKRPEFVDHGSLGVLRSISSRSSSCSSRSTQHSSSSTATITITRVTSEPRLGNRNHFFYHPSPKPQIRVSSARLERVGSTNSTPRKHKFSMWDFFRLGLVRTPDIELQELNKVNFIRSNSRVNNKGSSSSPPSVSRNNSLSNNNNNSNIISPIKTNNSTTTNSNTVEKDNGAVLNVEKQKSRKFLSGCKCSVDAVVAPNIIMVKSKRTTPNAGHCNSTSGAKHSSMYSTKEKVLLAQHVHRESKATSSRTKNDNKQQHNNADQKQRQKQVMSHLRTYEWLKDLSHANLSMHV